MRKVLYDKTAGLAVKAILNNLFEGIAYLDEDTIETNLNLACAGGMSESDRSISSDLAKYMMSHISLIYLGLIVNAGFRESVRGAVSIEMGINGLSEAEVAKVRTELKSGKNYKNEGHFTIDLSRFNESIFVKVNEKIGHSFKPLFDHGDEIDEYIDALTDDNIIEIGFCVSNFMYFIRALSRNEVFAEYVKSVTHDVEEVLKNVGTEVLFET